MMYISKTIVRLLHLYAALIVIRYQAVFLMSYFNIFDISLNVNMLYIYLYMSIFYRI